MANKTSKRSSSKTSKKIQQQEKDVFVQSLDKANQIQDADQPLHDGATHVRTVDANGEVLVTRRRFSAT